MQEVVVVGGGIAGAAVVLELLERGVAVNLVDPEGPGGAATGASAGMLAPQYESAGPGPLYELAVAARAAYPTFVARVEALSDRSLHLRWDGMLVANFTEEERAHAEEDVVWQRASGHEAEVIGIAEARGIEPQLGDRADSYLWLPREGQVDSQALALSLPDALRATDARVIIGPRVAELIERGGRAAGVRLEDGRELEADAVVLAAGAWSGEIEGLPRTLPVRPVRGHMLRFPADPVELGPLVATHAGRYLVPRVDGTILAGSTMDDVGFDRSLSDEGIAAVVRSAARLIPALAGLEPAERWADLRPLTLDGAPVLGPDPEVDGLFYATGYGRNGILLGPLAGRIVAELVVGEAPSRAWESFAADRFSP